MPLKKYLQEKTDKLKSSVGNAHANGGDWGLKQDERALTGEIGDELVVITTYANLCSNTYVIIYLYRFSVSLFLRDSEPHRIPSSFFGTSINTAPAPACNLIMFTDNQLAD